MILYANTRAFYTSVDRTDHETSLAHFLERSEDVIGPTLRDHENHAETIVKRAVYLSTHARQNAGNNGFAGDGTIRRTSSWPASILTPALAYVSPWVVAIGLFLGLSLPG
jgi:hypothetical protein